MWHGANGQLQDPWLGWALGLLTKFLAPPHRSVAKPAPPGPSMCSHPDRAPHGPQVMVVGFYHQHMGRVPFPVQGPWASHQEPAADVEPEVVAMVTCGEAHEMHGLDPMR